MSESTLNLKIQKDLLLETLSDNMGYYFRSKKRLAQKATNYQNLEIIETADFGKVLRLDGVFQTSERDEFLYHEPLVHVAGISMNGPKSALVIGGGDGGSIEEILKYKTIEKVVMVELDKEVVQYCKEYLPSISKNAFSSEILDLRFEDGIQYIENVKERFDLVILDLTDPFGPSVALYSKEFYKSINRILNPQGALTLHIESPISHPDMFAGLYWTLKEIFDIVRPMLNYVPMYGTLWGFASASQNLDPLSIAEGMVDLRITELDLYDLQFYNNKTHFSLLNLPNYIENLLKKQVEPFTIENQPQLEKTLEGKMHIIIDK